MYPLKTLKPGTENRGIGESGNRGIGESWNWRIGELGIRGIGEPENITIKKPIYQLNCFFESSLL